MPDNEAIDIIAAGGPGKVISFYDSMVAQIIIHGPIAETPRASWRPISIRCE